MRCFGHSNLSVQTVIARCLALLDPLDATAERERERETVSPAPQTRHAPAARHQAKLRGPAAGDSWVKFGGFVVQEMVHR